MSQKIVFLHCVDMTQDAMRELKDILMVHEEYTFILSNQEIKSVNKEELMRVLTRD